MTVQLPVSTTSQSAKLSASDFWLLANAGAFNGFVKAELIEGEIRVVNAVHSLHARAHAALTGELYIALRRSSLVLLSTPSTNLSDNSVPEPDIAIATKVDGKTLDGADLRLAIEISDTTLADDLGRKMHLYARHGIPEYWVVDVDGRLLHQMWSPSGEAYGKRREHVFGERVEAATLDCVVVETGGLR